MKKMSSRKEGIPITHLNIVRLSRCVQSLADAVHNLGGHTNVEARQDALAVRDLLWVLERKTVGASKARRAWSTHLADLLNVKRGARR